MRRSPSLAARLATFARIVVVGAAFAAALTPRTAAAADPWLFVNDVHYDPTSHHSLTELWDDTSPALLVSTLNAMRRVAPNPPVIVMSGDFLSHSFKPATAVPTMAYLAHRFGAAFPHAQFVLALGNEDSACGDYAVPPDGPFLRAVAKAWGPLVDRHGAAPGFARGFAHDGFYVARLPTGVQAVVVNDAFWSPFYHAGCGSHADPTPGSFDELRRALRPAAGARRWLIMHIPPGVDVASTLHRAHRLAIVPFLRPGPRDEVLALVGDPRRGVQVVVSGHIHRFAYRLIERGGTSVPLLVAPAISPIFGNAPSFLSADMRPDGAIGNLEEHSLVGGRWRDVGGLAALGVSEFSGAALENLQRRLERDRSLRKTFATLYVGGARIDEINERNWRSYWCGASALGSTAFRDCADESGWGFLTRRGVIVVAVAAAGALLVAGAALAIVVALVRRARVAGAERSEPRPTPPG